MSNISENSKSKNRCGETKGDNKDLKVKKSISKITENIYKIMKMNK